MYHFYALQELYSEKHTKIRGFMRFLKMFCVYGYIMTNTELTKEELEENGLITLEEEARRNLRY